MAIAHSKLTAQGQISVPAEVRRKLGITAGAVLEWDEDGGQIIVRRRADIHQKTFIELYSLKVHPKPAVRSRFATVFCEILENGMRAVDTNVLVRLTVRDDPKQVLASEEFISHGAWVPHLALAETSSVLHAVYDRTPAQIATAIEMLLSHKDLTLQDADAVEAALVHYRKKPSLGFSDCLVLEVARKNGHLPLGTFDRNLSKLEGTHRL